MRAVLASGALAGAFACHLSLDLDHTFHADAGVGGAPVSSQGGSDAPSQPSSGQAGAAGSAAPSGASGADGIAGGTGGVGVPPDGGNQNAADDNPGIGGNEGGALGMGGTTPEGEGGSGGAPPLATCSGCVEMIVPVSTAGDKAVFEFQLDDAPLDLSAAVITWRVQPVNDTPSDWSDSGYMVIKAYAQSPPPPRQNPPGYFTDALLLSLENFEPNTWHELIIDFGSFPDAAAPGDFDKTNAFRIGLELAAGSGFFGTHDIRVFVDSVAFTGVPELSDRSFDTGFEGFVLNTFGVPMSTRLQGHFQP